MIDRDAPDTEDTRDATSKRGSGGSRIATNRLAVAVVGVAVAVVLVAWLLSRLGAFELADLRPPGIEDLPLYVMLGGVVIVLVAWSVRRLGSILEFD